MRQYTKTLLWVAENQKHIDKPLLSMFEALVPKRKEKDSRRKGQRERDLKFVLQEMKT